MKKSLKKRLRKMEAQITELQSQCELAHLKVRASELWAMRAYVRGDIQRYRTSSDPKLRKLVGFCQKQDEKLNGEWRNTLDLIWAIDPDYKS